MRTFVVLATAIAIGTWGCAAKTPDTPATVSQPPVAATQPATPDTPVSQPPVAATPPATPPPAAKPVTPATAQPAPATAPAPGVPAPRTASKPAAPVAKTPAPAAQTPKPAPRPAAPPVSAPAARAAPATLDVNALKERLKATKAIGVMTKISLKNKVDDLMDEFRLYYQGKSKVTMTDLRQTYNLLMMKVLSLLQEDDQPLASAIVSSREAIWALLANPTTFATLES